MIIRRKLGPKGQLVIPKDIREMLGVLPGDEIFIEIDGADVKIRPADKGDDYLDKFFQISKKLDKRIDIEGQLDEEYG